MGAYNCIVQDPFYDLNHIFVIDGESESIFQAKDCSLEGKGPELAEVWSSPEPPSVSSGPLLNGEYNPSVSFPSSDKALFADGRGTLYILKTGNRSIFGHQWGIAFKDEICGKKQPYTLVSSCMNNNTLHCLIQYVEESSKVMSKQDKQKMPKVNFTNVVEWLTFAESSAGWVLDRARKFLFYGGIDYIHLKNAVEENKKIDDAYLVSITNKPFKLIYDSSGANVDGEENGTDDAEMTNDTKKVGLDVEKKGSNNA